MDIFDHIYFEAFSFPHCEQALLHIYMPCQLSQHALLSQSYHLQLVQCVCVCVFVFLVNKWIYLIKVLQLRRHSWYGNTWKRSHRTLCPNAHDAFCANTHNSSGLICCSFPSPLLSLSSKPMGLMAQDLSLLPLLVVRL